MVNMLHKMRPKPQFGNSVSKSHTKTKRKFKINKQARIKKEEQRNLEKNSEFLI